MNVIWIGLGYLVIINVVTFLVYGIDKRKAVKHKYRISEKSLIVMALIGGSIGALIGMRVFHHKIKHVKFVVGVPFILIFQVAIGIGIWYLVH